MKFSRKTLKKRQKQKINEVSSFQRLIDHSSDFSLVQYRLVMNIICSIAYSDPPCDQLKDIIDMLVKKQVSSSIKNIKNRGIIGVVRVIDHMVWEKKEIINGLDDNSDNNSYDTVESLPTKLSKIAANYILLTITSSESCPNHMALFFDELSSVFIVRNAERLEYRINKPFLTWIISLITGYFEDNFVVDELPPSSAQWDFQMLRDIKTNRDTESICAINIAGTLLNSTGR